MNAKAAITVDRPPEEVQRLWNSPEHRHEHVEQAGATVTFETAPGDRGTEIHVSLDQDARGGRLGEIVQKAGGAKPLAKIKDDLRRFKQRVETGEIARSEAIPEGELAERKLNKRPAQPLDGSELGKAAV